MIYDCREIEVSSTIANILMENYKMRGFSQEERGMIWLLFGPKVNEDLNSNDVAISECFIVNMCEHT